MNYRNVATLSAVAALALLPACGSSYRKTHLSPLSSGSSAFQESKGNITIRAKRFSRRETAELFEGRGKYLTDKRNGLVPVQVQIKNKSAQTVTVHAPRNAWTNTEDIYKRMEKNVAAITTASAAGGLLLGGLPAIAFGTGFGVTSTQYNEKMKQDIEDVTLSLNETVHAQNKGNKILFFKESDLGKSFKLSTAEGARKVDFTIVA